MPINFDSPLFNNPLRIEPQMYGPHDECYIDDDFQEITCSMVFSALVDKIKEAAYKIFSLIKKSIVWVASSCKTILLKAAWLYKSPNDDKIKPIGSIVSQDLVQRIKENKINLKASGVIRFQEATLNRRSIVLIDVVASLKNSRHEIPIHSRFFIDKKMIPKNICLQDALSFLFKKAAMGGLQDKLSQMVKEVAFKHSKYTPNMFLTDLQDSVMIDENTQVQWHENYAQLVHDPEDSFVHIDSDQKVANLDYDYLDVELGTQINLLPYLNEISLLDGLEPDQIIEFKNGGIVKAGDKTIKGQKNLFVNFLKATYGSSLAAKIAERYQLNDDSPLTFKQFKEALVGIAARVTIRDVKKLFEEIQKSSRFMLCHYLLSDKDKQSLREAVEFQDLSYSMILKLINCFRRAPQSLKQVSMQKALWGKLIYDEIELKQKLNLSVNCRHDMEVLVANEYLFHLEESELAFAISEHSAKRLAYVSADVGMIFPLLDSLKGPALYEVRSKLKDLNDGVVAHFMTPIRTDSDSQYNSGSGALPIILNFRGTQTSSERMNAFQSLVRDSDPSGVGRTSFSKRKREILDGICAIIETKKENFSKFHLHINGHSLGGVDVQRALALVVSEIAREGHHPNFDLIHKITACAHNSPGIESDVNNQFSINIKQIKCPVDLSYVFFDSDPIQIAGSVYLGAQVSSDNFNKKAIELRSNQKKFIKAHSAKGFDALDPQFSRTFLDPSHDLESIERRLGKWDYWDSVTGRIAHQIFSTALFVPQAVTWGALRLGHTIYRITS